MASEQMQKLEGALRRARALVRDHEATVEHAKYGLKNAKAILQQAEEALSAHLDALDAGQV